MTDQPDRRFRALRISGLSLVVAVLVGTSMGVSVAVGAGTVAPPPTFAFVATAYNFPDALAVGPVAGQLGAPLFLTNSEALDANARAGLQGVDPEVVVIAGGEAAVSKAVEDEIKTLLPGADVRRAAGTNRTETAKLVSDIIGEFNPAFLPAGATAADADLLDGKDSTAFLASNGTAADSDLLDGKDSSAFLESAGKAVDADQLDGLDSTEFTRTFLTRGPGGDYAVPWGQQFDLLRLSVPPGPDSAPSTGYYDVAFHTLFGNPLGATPAAGSLTCDVRSAGSGSSVMDSTATAPDGVELAAESSPFRPLHHSGGFLAVSCMNTLEDGSGDPISLTWCGGCSSFRAEQISLEEWQSGPS